MSKKEKVFQWVKKHKVQLVIGGISVSVLGISAYLFISHNHSISSPEVVLELTHTSTPSRSPFTVNKHIRTLPNGHHPSATKIATAAENGFLLGDNQTWVDEYIKNLLPAA